MTALYAPVIPDRKKKPVPKGSIIWSIMEGALQEGFDNLPGWSDLTVRQIAEVLATGTETVRYAASRIRRRTGFNVPYVRGQPGRPLDE